MEYVFIFAAGIEAYPEGKVPLTCSSSERYEHDYITDQACTRIGNPRVTRGKVTLPYIPSGQTKSMQRTFLVVNYDDAETDVGFKIKVPEEIPVAHAGDHATGMQLHIGM